MTAKASFARRHLTTIVLVGLAAAGSAALILDRGTPTTQETEHRKHNLVPAWRLDDIHAATLTAHGKTAKLTLGAPTDAGQRLWQVELGGEKFLANQQMVDQLLGTLEYATFERAVSKDAVSEAELGLGSPVTSVSVEMGPKTYRLAVGGNAPTPKDARYCETDAGVFVITAQLAAALDMQPEALRSRQFVPYLSTELAGLSIDGEGGARHFARASWSGSRGAGFRFDGSTPEGDVRADAEEIDRVLGALGGLQAETFLADDEADKALSKRVTITLAPRAEKQPKAIIEVGGACPGKEGQIVAVRREPSRTSACVPESVMEALVAPASDFVDLHVTGARADEMSELTFTQGEKVIDIARVGGGWHMRKPSDQKVSSDAGNAVADGLAGLSGAKVVSGDAKELGLVPPRATVRVLSSSIAIGADGATVERVETIEVGAAQGEIVHVRRAEDGAILELPADKVQALMPVEVALRDATVLDVPREQVRGVAVQSAAGGAARAQKVERTATGWAFVGSPVQGLAVDAGLVSDVVDPIVGLKAMRWVAAKDDGSFGLEKPRFVVELQVAEKEGAPVKSVRIELGAATRDGVFARTGEDPAVFVAPRAIEEAAERWLFDRQALVVDEGALVKIEAAGSGAKTVVAERAGDAWTSPAGADVAATVRDAVTGLVAEGVVSVGAPERAFGLDKPRLVLRIVAEPAQGAAKDAPRRTIEIAFGAGDSFRGTSVVYARRKDLDATFAVAAGKVRALFDAAGVK
ncbi:MAG: DUF4340 domain-containing protein [Polyangiaceae bacterium]